MGISECNCSLKLINFQVFEEGVIRNSGGFKREVWTHRQTEMDKNVIRQTDKQTKKKKLERQTNGSATQKQLTNR